MTWLSLALTALLWTLHAFPPEQVGSADLETTRGPVRLTVSGLESDSPFAALVEERASTAAHASSSRTTLPCTSVSRNSRP